MRRAPFILIFIGLLLAAGNFGILSGQWIAPAILIGIGIIALAFPRTWEGWRSERSSRRARRHEERSSTTNET
jgi:hypothetical protein